MPLHLRQGHFAKKAKTNSFNSFKVLTYDGGGGVVRGLANNGEELHFGGGDHNRLLQQGELHLQEGQQLS